MLQLTQLSGLMTPRFYVAKAVNFDGSNDYMSKPGGFTGALDAKVGTISVWLRFNGGDGTLQRLFGPATGSAGLYIFKNLDNKIYVLGYNSAVAIVMNFNSSGAFTSSSGWNHFLASWDLAGASLQMYVNDANASPAITTNTNDTIDYTAIDWTIGALSTATDKLNADLADLYINFTTRVDISVETNRRKFISVARKPVELGRSGELPTGAVPTVFCKGPASTFNINRGNGGSFVVTGALTDSTMSPSS